MSTIDVARLAARFPDGFLWGTATASYQVEGAVGDDGRGESIWDRFCRVPGNVTNGDSGAIACDAYHRYASDVELMAGLGVRAYRFSVAWPRVIPSGTGAVNPAGLDYYDRLVDALATFGIEPFVTLYHWDLPQAVEDRGGWVSRDTAAAFADYAAAVADRLGDRVTYWTTLNEPWVSAHVGYLEGVHAPGIRDVRSAAAAAHHLMLAHGRGAAALRASLPRSSKIGLVLNLNPIDPSDDHETTIAAARRLDGYLNRWYLDATTGRGYPTDILDALGEAAPTIEAGDLERIAAPIDLLGINYYRRRIVAGDDPAEPFPHVRFVAPEGATFTEMGWEVYPDGLERTLRRVSEYGFPDLYVTENGAAFNDHVTADGRVDDEARTMYLADHLDAAARAIQAGVPLRGYFVWSLLDNFEWALGYSKRFGIVHVDYATQRRIPKGSAMWYAALISEHAARGAGR